MQTKVNTLRKLLQNYSLKQGDHDTAIKYLKAYRYNDKNIDFSSGLSHSLFYAVDGTIRLFTPSGILDYVSGQYSILIIDMPFSGQVISQSSHRDLLALSVEFIVSEVLSVLISFDGNLAQQILDDKLSTMFKERADRNVTDCLLKLIALLDDKQSLEFMSNHIKREIIFNVLCGSYGTRFLQSITGGNKNSEIYDINTWIKQNFKENFTVEEIAKQNNMSVSALHQKFKNAIGMGLLQCQKRLRLSEARRLMLNDEKCDRCCY